MTISYTALLGLAQPVTGTETGQWGTVVNDEITALLEDAVANAASISVTAGNVTLSTTNGSSNQARMSTLIITGTPGTTRNVVAPSQAKIYVVINQSDGAVVIKGAATSGVTIGAGQTAQVAWNGSDFVEIGNYVHGNFVVNGNLSVNGDSTLGNAGADTTTINGQVIAANSNISKTTTLSASAPALAWIKGATYTDTGTAGGTTQALAPFTVFSAPTLSTSNIVTYTNAATVYVAGAPAAAGSATITNPYALYVAAGDAYFGASVVLNAGTAYGVPYLSSPGKVLTTGSALTFDGTNLGVNSASPIDGGRFSVAFAGNTQNGIGLKDTADASGASFWGAYNSTGGFIGSLRRSGTDNALAINGNSYLAFQQNSTELMRLTSTGLKSSIAGTNADPVFSYTSDTNTGIFFPAADKLGFTAGGGSDQMVLTSTGLGIGTNNPGAKLHVVGASGSGDVQIGTNAGANQYQYINFGGTNGGTDYGWQVGRSSNTSGLGGNGAFYFYDIKANATRMSIDSSGNLGLGVTPSAWSGAGKIIQFGNGNASIGTQNNGDANFLHNAYESPAGTFKYASSNPALRYQLDINNNAHKWYTAPSGFGYGTAATSLTATQNGNSYTIVTAGTTDFTLIGAADNNVGTVFTKSGGTGAGTGTVSQNISFTQAMTLDASGNLGIGTSSPGQKLEILTAAAGSTPAAIFRSPAGVGNTGGLAFYANDTNASARNWYVVANSNSYGDFVIKVGASQGANPTAGNDVATFTSSGNLGLGVTPSAWTAYKVLQINTGSYASSGNNAFVGSNWFYDGADKYIASDYATLYRQYLGAHAWFTAPSGTAGNAITFTQAMTLDASGNLALGTTNVTGYWGSTAVNARNVVSYSSSDTTFDTSTKGLVVTNSDTTTGNFSSLVFGTNNSGNTSIATAAVYSVNKDSRVVGFTTADLAFATVGGSGVLSERARITSGGDLLVGITTTYGKFTALNGTSDASQPAGYFQNNKNFAGIAGVRFSSGNVFNDTGHQAFSFDEAATLRFEVRSNGGIANYQANDANLSDRREKTNFAPAKSYLDTICAIPVQTFNYIDQSENDPGLTLGVVAQDVQAVAPELVMESNWGTKEDPKMRLSIYQTDLQYALMKALQELKAEFDAYKATHP